MLAATAGAQQRVDAESKPLRQPRLTIAEQSAYIDEVKRESARHLRDGGPWIAPRRPFEEAIAINAQRRQDGEQPLSTEEISSSILRPQIFQWSPADIYRIS